MLLIDVDDLRVDFLTLGQNVFGLADAAVSDLGDVDQASLPVAAGFESPHLRSYCSPRSS